MQEPLAAVAWEEKVVQMQVSSETPTFSIWRSSCRLCYSEQCVLRPFPWLVSACLWSHAQSLLGFAVSTGHWVASWEEWRLVSEDRHRVSEVQVLVLDVTSLRQGGGVDNTGQLYRFGQDRSLLTTWTRVDCDATPLATAS